MHTSEVLSSTHFAYTRHGAAVDAAAVFPEYHPQDRVGVVAPVYEDGLDACAGTLLALTTLFYDAQRATGREFFTYPQHFCVLAWNGDGVRTRRGRVAAPRDDVGEAWCKLDVWPGNRWLAAGADPAPMLKAVFDHQLNRVVWPAGFWPAADSQPALPAFARAILATDLKQVLLYGDGGETTITAGAPAAKLAATAQAHAPVEMARAPAGERHESFTAMPVAAFLDALAPAFAAEG